MTSGHQLPWMDCNVIKIPTTAGLACESSWNISTGEEANSERKIGGVREWETKRRERECAPGPDSRALCLSLGWYAQKRDDQPLYSHASHISVAPCVQHCVYRMIQTQSQTIFTRMFCLTIFLITRHVSTHFAYVNSHWVAIPCHLLYFCK